MKSSTTLYIDGGYLFDKLLYETKKEQRKLFESKLKIGDYLPLNSYVLAFDTLARASLKYKEFLASLKKVQNFNNIVFIKTYSKPQQLKYYDVYNRRVCDIRYYIANMARITDKYISLHKTQKTENIIDKHIAFLRSKFNIKDKSNTYKLDFSFNSTAIKVSLFYDAIYQNYINPELHCYLYNIFSENKRHKKIIKVKYLNDLKNCFVLTNKKLKNNLCYDFYFNKFGQLKNERPKIERFEEIKEKEKRNLNKVCEECYGNVLNVNDDNILITIGKVNETYKIKKRNNKLIDKCGFPSSFINSNYSLFKKQFIKINENLNLDLEKYL